MTNPIPEGTEHRFVPYLMVDGAAAAIDFYVAAFGAEEDGRLAMPDGSIGHASLLFDGAPLYLADAPADMSRDRGMANPAALGASSVILHRYVEDVDADYAQAIGAGATSIGAPTDEFYGDRTATVRDPFGHVWSLHSHIRDVSMEEMASAMEEPPST